MSATKRQIHNPIPELIDDAAYSDLLDHGLIDMKALRDYQIRRRFFSMRSGGTPAVVALEEIHKDHMYLQPDTIRKIVYRTYRR